MPDEASSTGLETNLDSASMGAQGAPESSTPDVKSSFESILPEEYKTKEYVQNALRSENPMASILKSYESSQTMLGQRQVLSPPGADATDEQRQTFNKAMGVPDNITGYELKSPEFAAEDKELGEFLLKGRNDAVLNDVKEVARSVGVNPTQLQALANAFDTSSLKHQKDLANQMFQAERESEQSFEAIADKHYGAEKLQVMERGQKLMKEMLPPEFMPYVARMNPEGLAVAAAMANSFYNKHMKEDGISTRGSASTPAADIQSLRNEARSLMATEAFGNEWHINHKNTAAKVQGIYTQIKQMSRT